MIIDWKITKYSDFGYTKDGYEEEYVYHVSIEDWGLTYYANAKVLNWLNEGSWDEPCSFEDLNRTVLMGLKKIYLRQLIRTQEILERLDTYEIN